MKSVRLGEFVRIRRGASPRPIDDPRWFSDSGPGWVRISDVTRSGKYLEETEQRLSPEAVERSVRVRPGDVILSVAASVGVPAIVNMDACIHDGWVVLTDFEHAFDREYLYYLLSYQAPRIAARGQTGSQTNINSDILRNWRVAVPPMEIQRAIGQSLARVDNLIRRVNSLITTKREFKRRLMQELLTGRRRFPEFGAPSTGQGRPPEGWCRTSLGDVATIRVSNVDKHYRPEHIPVRLCNYMDVWTRPYIRDDQEFMKSTASPREVELFQLRAGDVLLTKDSETREEIAEPSVVLSAGNDLVLGYHLALVRPNPDLVDGRFLASQLRAPRFRQHFVRSAQGATRFGLTIDSLQRAEVWLPSVDEQRRVAELDLMLYREIEMLEGVRDQFETEHRGLMQKLLTGELAVSVSSEPEPVNA